MPRIRVNGVELNYIREGRGEPLLLVHGYMFGCDYWRPQIDALKGDYDVVAPDLRGQMGSEPSPDPAGYDLWNQAEDMYQLIQALEIAPVHWVGLSMGGFIGMRLFLRHPEVIRSFVFMDTQALPEVPELAEQHKALMAVVADGDLEAVMPAIPISFLADDYIRDQPEAVEAWLQQLRESDVGALMDILRAIDAREDLTDKVGAINVPTLVIHGTEDVAIDVERGKALADAIPGARFETVDGGHQSNVDRPAGTTRLIVDFLASLRGAPAAAGG